MSKVKITGNASGSGVFTITSPNSNTDRTITLPDASVTLGTDATKLPLAGGTLTGDLNFGDNVDANFGAGADLKIYHDASNSYIDESGTGYLILRSNRIRMKKYTGEDIIDSTADGSVKIFHDNAKKFETSATGVTVTGDLTSDNFQVKATAPGSPSQGDVWFNSSASTVSNIPTKKMAVYNGSGWKEITNSGMAASGGTKTTSGGYTIHTFTSSGTFTPDSAGVVDYLVVAGGGGGAGYGGAGGAGGFRTATGFAVTAGGLTVTVGAGGAGVNYGNTSAAGNGANSVFSSITSIGGGGGSARDHLGAVGGSGGGGNGGYNSNGGAGTSGQGNRGGNGVGTYFGGAGGGASAVGGSGTNTAAMAGGAGTVSNYSGSSVTYAGGGGGATDTATGGGAGGAGGGGKGFGNDGAATNGAANTGGGAGAGGSNIAGHRDGGSGIVIIRYLT